MNCTHWSQRLLPACPPEVAPEHDRLQSQSQEKGALGHLQVERGQQEVRRCGAQWCPGSVHRSSRLDIKPDKYIVKIFNNISNKINSVSYLFGYMYLHIPLKYPAISFISASPRLKSARARAASTPGPAHLQYYPEL